MNNLVNAEKVLKALANRRRLAILVFLKKNREGSVSRIAGAINLSFKSTSRHLNVMMLADILEKEQRSTEVFYKIYLNLEKMAKGVVSLL